MSKFTDPKVWAPIVGVVALVAGYSTGLGVDEATQGAVVDQLTAVATNVEALYLGGAAALAGVAAWFARKPAPPEN